MKILFQFLNFLDTFCFVRALLESGIFLSGVGSEFDRGMGGGMEEGGEEAPPPGEVSGGGT
jgi:hypothetical protein